MWNKTRTFYLGLREEHIRKSEARLEKKKSPSGNHPVPRLLSTGLSPFISWACWTSQEPENSQAGVRLWSVMCCAVLPPSGFAPWLPHCSVQEQMDWSFPRSHPWHLWLADNWLQPGHVMKQRTPKPPRSSSPLTEASTRLFLLKLLPVLPLWGLITYWWHIPPIMCWAVAHFWDFGSTIEILCQISTFRASSEVACTIHLNQLLRKKETMPRPVFSVSTLSTSECCRHDGEPCFGVGTLLFS